MRDFKQVRGRKTLTAGLVLACAVATPSMATDISEGVVRIGIINDQSGPYAGTGGPGSVIAAQMAVEDLGSELDGIKVEIIGADHQNKPDIASSIVREWTDVGGFDAVADGASSAASLAIQDILRERGKVFLISGAGSSDFTGKACSPTGFQFAYDTYGLSQSNAKALVAQGLDRWFILTADYAYGHALESDAKKFLEAAGGEVVGTIRHPFGANDFSSFLLTAAGSDAEIIALANGGTDFSQSLKQATEFGLASSGKQFASLSGMITDVHAAGLDAAQGLFITESFYWDMNDETRAFSQRFMERNKGNAPTMVQAGVYAGVHHYLKAVKAAGTDEGKAVADKMREIPVNNFFHDNTKVREDGRVLLPMHLFKVKSPDQSKSSWDLYDYVTSTPGEEVFRPLADGGCAHVSAAN